MDAQVVARQIVDTWDPDRHAEYPELVRAITAALDASKPQWTTEKPVREGWYWWRNHRKVKDASMTQVFKDHEGCHAEGYKVAAHYWDGEWYGPLEPPL